MSEEQRQDARGRAQESLGDFDYEIDPAAELEALRVAQAELIAWRERLGPTQFERVPTVSGWSAAGHFYHLLLAGDLALRNVRSLVAGRGRLIVSEGAPNALAREVLVRGSYPRGASQAPRMVLPPDPIDPELLALEVAHFAGAIEAAAGLLPELPAAAGRIPHHALAQLNAAEWLRFARLHTEHHLAIVRDIALAEA